MAETPHSIYVRQRAIAAAERDIAQAEAQLQQAQDTPGKLLALEALIQAHRLLQVAQEGLEGTL